MGMGRLTGHAGWIFRGALVLMPDWGMVGRMRGCKRLGRWMTSCVAARVRSRTGTFHAPARPPDLAPSEVLQFPAPQAGGITQRLIKALLAMVRSGFRVVLKRKFQKRKFLLRTTLGGMALGYEDIP